MLAVRVIPTLLISGGSLVKGQKFDAWRSVGHPLQAIRIHQMRGVDELLMIDISATREGRGPNFALIERLTRDCFSPLTIGGGVTSLDDIRGLLNVGADKVLIETGWMENPDLLNEASARFGSQAIVAGVTVSEGLTTSNCGTKVYTRKAAEMAVEAAHRGAGEILVQSIDRDGLFSGYDLELVESVSKAVPVPVIASCGCGDYAHMREAVRAGASAIAAGAFFQFTQATPRGAAEYLSENGIEARII